MDLASLINIAYAAEESVQATVENGGIAGTFGLDWKLMLAQFINFGLALFILWRWVVRPLSKTLNQRQARIEKSLKDAEVLAAERRAFEETRLAEMRKVRSEAEAVIAGATAAGEKIKAESIQEAKSSAERLLNQTRDRKSVV